MFTGIIEERGSVLSVTDLGDAARLVILGREVTAEPTNNGNNLFIEARGNFEYPAVITLSPAMEGRLLELLLERDAERKNKTRRTPWDGTTG